MTPDRLAEIIDWVRHTDYDDHPEAHDLLDEVDRLRAAIESQIEAARSEWLDEGNADALARAEHWRTLLHPTEESA